MSFELVADDWFPLSFAQRSRWFLYAMDPAMRGRHNNGFAARVLGQLELGGLRDAIEYLVTRHPALRTCYRERNGEPEQCVAQQLPVCVDERRAESWDVARLERDIANEFLKPFELTGTALVRATLYRVAFNEAILVISFDHIAVDGWSYWKLIDELGILLDGTVPARPSTDQKTYQDFVHWQRGWLDSIQGQGQLCYWREHLAEPLPAPIFAHNGHRVEKTADMLHRHAIELPAALAESLKAFSVRHACTLYVTLLTGYALLLQRYCAEDDLIIGVPLPGRSDQAWDQVVGDFVNPLPLRIHLDPQVTLSELLRQVRRTAMGALTNQDYPFSQLVDRLGIDRAATVHPLFQTSFTYQKVRHGQATAGVMTLDATETAVRWGGVKLSPFPIQQSGMGALLPLQLETLEVPTGIRCNFTSSAAYFDAAEVSRMAEHFECLLQSMVDANDSNIGELEIFKSETRQQVLHIWNETVGVRPSHCIAQLFEAQVARTPDRLAIFHEGRELTYRQLDIQANRLAHCLIKQGVTPQDLVGLCIDRGLEWMVGVLGVLKAGAAYLPLDPSYPIDRIEYMIEDASPRVLLTQEHLRQTLEATVACPISCLDAQMSEPQRSGLVAPLRVDDPAHLAYVIYTSGSTGKPKGVAVSQRAVVNLLAALQERVYGTLGDRYRSGDGLRVGMNASLSFDASVQQWLMLLTGATLYLVPEAIRYDPQQLAAIVGPWKLDVLDCTPAQLPVVLSGSDRVLLAGCLLIGGEAIDRETWRNLLARSELRCFNLYGPTEATVDTLICDIRAAGQEPLLGRPIRNARVYVLDQTLNPVPMGVVGEIYIGGDGLARGYLHRPALTAQRFVADPFSAVPGTRMYRSGDLGRYRPDGSLEYIRRVDHQVKVRGYRIELGEIEATLAALTEASQVEVIVREDCPGERKLVAYLVAGESQPLPDCETLRERLLRKLPEFMVPARFVVLDKLPLTANGKVDRAALPAPDPGARTGHYMAPANETEACLAAIWGSVLKLERIGREDDFFDLGGHSLMIAQVAARIRDAFSIEPTLRGLFEHSRLDQQAAMLDALSRNTSVLPASELIAGPRPARLPLSYAQERLWLLEQIETMGTAYSISGALRITGRLDDRALEWAMTEIVRRHESLRTRIVADGETLTQVIAPTHLFALERLDLTDMQQSMRRETALQHVREFARRGFDLADGLPFRVVLIRLSDDEHIAVVSMHHIVSDGWSLGVLVREMGALYAAHYHGQPSPLADLPVQYADFALWQRAWMCNTVLKKQADYWKSTLRDMPAGLNMPLDRPRPSVQSYRGDKLDFVLSAKLTQGMTTLARSQNATLFMVLLAGFQHVLARWSSQEDVVIGTPVAGRNHRAVEGLIGFFVNIVVLRTNLAGAPSLRQLLERAKETALQAYSHQDLPFERLVEEINPVRDLSRPPIVQVMINSIPAADRPKTLDLPGLNVEALQAGDVSARFEIMLRVLEDGDSVACSLEYATDLFDAATIEWLARHYCSILERAVAEPDRPMVEFALPGSEFGLMHMSLLEKRAPKGSDNCIDQFAVRAGFDPKAFVYNHDGAIRYSSVDECSRRVAAYLRINNVTPGATVGLIIENDSLVSAALLGIFHAGAVCLPLSPAYADEYLRQLASDAAAVLILGAQGRVAALAQLGCPGVEVAQAISTQSRESADIRSQSPRPDAVCCVFPIWSGQGNRRLLTMTYRGMSQRISAMIEARALGEGLPSPDAIGPLCEMLLPLVSAAGAEPAGFEKKLPMQVMQLGLVLQFVRDHSGADGQVFLRALPGIHVYVLGPQLTPMPPCLVGDIYVDTASWTLGYWADAQHGDLVACASLPGAKLLRTGMRGRVRSDGRLECTGRLAHTWIDGYPIDLAEVEAALRVHPKIDDALVVRRDDGATPCLVAYVTIKDGETAALAESEWRKILEQRLAAHQMPKSLVVLERLPSSAESRFDWRVLPAPDALHRKPVAPCTSIERELARLWVDVLGVDQVGMEDNFFDLGGHSLLATILSARIRQLFGVELPLRAMFESTDLRSLALLITEARSPPSEVLSVDSGGEEGVL